MFLLPLRCRILSGLALLVAVVVVPAAAWGEARLATVFADHMVDRKSTRLNSSHW